MAGDFGDLGAECRAKLGDIDVIQLRPGESRESLALAKLVHDRVAPIVHDYKEHPGAIVHRTPLIRIGGLGEMENIFVAPGQGNDADSRGGN